MTELAQAEPALTSRASAHLAKLTAGESAIGCTAFAAFAHLQRLQRLTPEAAALIPEDRAAVLNWYVGTFGPFHAPLRLPLSDDDVGFLLSDDPLAGLPFAIPRIVLWQALAPGSGAPPLVGADAKAELTLASWWTNLRAPSLGTEHCLVPERYRAILDQAPAKPVDGPPAPLPSPAIGTARPDVEVIGPLHQQSGLGRAARLSVETFRRAGAKVLATDFSYGFPSPASIDHDLLLDPGIAGPAPAAVLHLNPDMLPWAFVDGRQVPKRRAGYFFWELDRPATCDFLAFDLVEEIWTASNFVGDVYRPYFNGIVDCVGLAMPPIARVNPDACRADLRRSASLSAGTFVFLSVFDGYSYVERKNPLGAVMAFRAAFPDRTDVALVIKTHNRPRGGTTAQNEIWREIDRTCIADQRIRIIDETFDHADVLRLIAGADVFVSLHRSEGWGLGPVEAMQLGISVIATAYSGTEDFCTDDTAFRVPFGLVPVRSGDYVHAEPHHRWAEPDAPAVALAFRDAFTNIGLRQSRVEAARDRIAGTMSFDVVGQRYVRALERLLARP